MPIVHDPETGRFSSSAGGPPRVANIHMGSPKLIVQQGRGGRIFAASGKSPVTGQEIKVLGKGPKGAERAWLQASAQHAAKHLTRENWKQATENIAAGKQGIP